MTPPLPPGPFGTIVADPAWAFRDRGVRGAAEKHYKTMSVEQIARLNVEDIAAENAQLFLWAPDAFIVDGSASLVARMWGFKPKQLVCWRKVKGGDVGAVIDVALARLAKNTNERGDSIALDDGLRDLLQGLADVRKAAKPQMGQGYRLRHCFEIALLCVRGKVTAPEGAKNILAMFDAERTDEHSEKPDEIFRIAERMSPGPRLEMFARAAREGWTVWGDQAPQATTSPEQIVERLNEKVRKIMEDGGRQIARIAKTDGSIDGALEKARADFAAVRDARRGVVPAKSSPPRYDKVYAAGTAALDADAASHAVGCYVSGMMEDGHTEVWACVDGCPIKRAERKMIAEHEEAVGPDPANLDAAPVADPPPGGYISRRSAALNRAAATAGRSVAAEVAVPITRDDDLHGELNFGELTVVTIRGVERVVGVIRSDQQDYTTREAWIVVGGVVTVPECGKIYRLPDGRVGEYVGGDGNFHVKSGPNGDGSIWKVLGEVWPTDISATVWCQTCGWLIAAEAAENAEACPYCMRSCPVCGAPQFDSPSGVTCENGHGGAGPTGDKR